MLILWITRRNREIPAAETGGPSFREHNEAMKRFRQSHPGLNVINARDIVLADGDLLAPVQGVKLENNTSN